MKAICKYSLLLGGSHLELPQGWEPLHVAMQDRQACLWALVDPDAPKVPALVQSYGMGFSLADDPGKFLGTAQQGPFVWHFFHVC